MPQRQQSSENTHKIVICGLCRQEAHCKLQLECNRKTGRRLNRVMGKALLGLICFTETGRMGSHRGTIFKGSNLSARVSWMLFGTATSTDSLVVLPLRLHFEYADRPNLTNSHSNTAFCFKRRWPCWFKEFIGINFGEEKQTKLPENTEQKA